MVTFEPPGVPSVHVLWLVFLRLPSCVFRSSSSLVDGYDDDEEEKEKEEGDPVCPSPGAFLKNGEPRDDGMKESAPASAGVVESPTVEKRFEVKEAFLSRGDEDDGEDGDGENPSEEKACFSSSSSTASLLKAFPEKSSVLSPSRGSGRGLQNSTRVELTNNRRREAGDKAEVLGGRAFLEDRFVRSETLFGRGGTGGGADHASTRGSCCSGPKRIAVKLK